MVTAVQLAARGTELALTSGTDVCLACPETAPQTVSNALPCVFAQNQPTDPKSCFKELFLYTSPHQQSQGTLAASSTVGGGGDQGHFLGLHIEQVDFQHCVGGWGCSEKEAADQLKQGPEAGLLEASLTCPESPLPHPVTCTMFPPSSSPNWHMKALWALASDTPK